jgi:hypothetical protein
MHAVSLAVGWGTAIAGISLDLYNAINWTCWIQAIPHGCKQSYKLGKGEHTNCERGDNAGIYQWTLFFAFLWTVWLFSLVLMGTICWNVLMIEKANEKYEFGSKEK